MTAIKYSQLYNFPYSKSPLEVYGYALLLGIQAQVNYYLNPISLHVSGNPYRQIVNSAADVKPAAIKPFGI